MSAEEAHRSEEGNPYKRPRSSQEGDDCVTMAVATPPLLCFLERDVEPALQRIIEFITKQELRVLTLVCRHTQFSAVRRFWSQHTRAMGVKPGLTHVRHLITKVLVQNVAEITQARAFYPNVQDLTVQSPTCSHWCPHRDECLPPPNDALHGLTTIRLVGWTIRWLNELTTVTSLVELEFKRCTFPTESGCPLDALVSLHSLRRLVLVEVASFPRDVLVFDFVSQLKQLESIVIKHPYMESLIARWRINFELFVDMPRLAVVDLKYRVRGGETSVVLPVSIKTVKVRATQLALYGETVAALSRLHSPETIVIHSKLCPGVFEDPQLPDLVPLRYTTSLRHLDLADFRFADISCLALCTELHTLNIGLNDDHPRPGNAVALRALTKLRTLTCRNLVVADFINVFSQLETFHFWLQPRVWTSETESYVEQHDQHVESFSLAPTLEILGLRHLRHLSIYVNVWGTIQHRLSSAWFKFITTECTRLESLEIKLTGIYFASYLIPSEGPDLSKLVRLTKLAAPRMIFTRTAETLLPLQRLVELDLSRWHIEFDLTPLYTVGLPLLSRLTMDTTTDCVPLKSYEHIQETLPMLDVLLHCCFLTTGRVRKRNCRWRLTERCEFRGPTFRCVAHDEEVFLPHEL